MERWKTDNSLFLWAKIPQLVKIASWVLSKKNKFNKNKTKYFDELFSLSAWRHTEINWQFGEIVSAYWTFKTFGWCQIENCACLLPFFVFRVSCSMCGNCWIERKEQPTEPHSAQLPSRWNNFRTSGYVHVNSWKVKNEQLIYHSIEAATLYKNLLMMTEPRMFFFYKYEAGPGDTQAMQNLEFLLLVVISYNNFDCKIT